MATYNELAGKTITAINIKKSNYRGELKTWYASWLAKAATEAAEKGLNSYTKTFSRGSESSNSRFPGTWSEEVSYIYSVLADKSAEEGVGEENTVDRNNIAFDNLIENGSVDITISW